MGYTNKTSHYELPPWIAGDKPSWLGDMNTAMLNIDTAIAASDASASAAESSAAAANAQVQAQEAKITKNATDIQALTESLADTQGEVNNVKTTADGALPKSGGTMTGNLILNGAPTSDLEAATKKYVDDNSGKGALMLSGGTMTGPLTLSGAPTTDLMAATKKYVDDAASGGGVIIKRFIPTQGGGTGQLYVSAAAINNLVIVNFLGVPSTAITKDSDILSTPGNPLGLTQNTKKNVGGIVQYTSAGAVDNNGELYVKYDGTSTDVFSTIDIKADLSTVGQGCGVI